MFSPERAAVVIPAFNEERRIAEVINVAQNASPFLVDVERVIVVDNNSTDRTHDIAEKMGALVLECPEQGKGQAMDVGVQYAREVLHAPVVTFLDADLTGLKSQSIDWLTQPVLSHETPMAVGIIDLWDNWLLKRIPWWPSLSGERSMRVDFWDRLRQEDKDGFYIETAINACAIEQGWFKQVQQIRLEGVTHDERRKIKESGLIRGSMDYVEVYTRALKTYMRGYKNRSTNVNIVQSNMYRLEESGS